MTLPLSPLALKFGLNPFGSDNEWIVKYVNRKVSGETFWRAVAAEKPPECADIIARYGRFVQPQDNGCWHWTGSRTGSWKGGQHGQFALTSSEHIYAHRLAYLLFTGDLSTQQVLHRCDVGYCVQPTHLFLGSQLDNVRDAKQKGRLPKYRQHRKMSPADVVECRALHARGWALIALANRYDVSKSCISLICNGKRRQHLPLVAVKERTA